MKVLLLLMLLLGSVFIFQSSAMLTPSQEDTETDEDDTDTESTDEEEEDDDSDDDGVDDETESAFEREIEMQQDPRRWEIESQLKNGETKDEFEIDFKIGGGDEPEIEFEYSTEAGDTESELGYRINFDEIIEYTENGTAGYQEGSDTVVGEPYDLGKADWNDIVYETITTDSGESLYTATASTTDGVFTLILKLSSGFTQVNSSIVTPNSIKIDVIIDGFDYQGNDTYLALQTDIKTEYETEVEEESEDEEDGFAQNEAQVRINSTQAAGFFSWVKHAEADGVVVDVIATNLISGDDEGEDLEPGESHKLMFFTFNAKNPDKIVWDPKVGVDNGQLVNAALQASDSGLPLNMWGILLLFAIPVLIRRRR